MAWLFQGVLNAGLQILLSIFAGWLCARLKLVDPEVMSRNVNAFAMKAAYPCFIIHLLGVKTDLRDGEAWRALGVFVLWVALIHLACLAVHKLRGRQRSSVLTLGLDCLLLTTNNTGCIGWPVLIATVGQQSAVLAMLLGVLFFIQLLPVAICCFESAKWQEQQEGVLAAPTACHHDDTAHAPDQLPVTSSEGKALPEGGFPGSFRYCYWSNVAYHPGKDSSYALLGSSSSSSAAEAQQRRQAALVQVCVDSGDECDDDSCHHCYGGGGARPSRITTTTSIPTTNGSSSSSTAVARAASTPRRRALTSPRAAAAAAAAAATAAASAASASAAPSGREWWRSGRGRASSADGGGPVPSGGPGGLKRAKDSCDSLYTPFAAAALADKQAAAAVADHGPPRPASMGLSSLTKRLSRGLSSAGAAAAAAASSAAAAVAGGGLSRAASLHAASPMKRATSMKKAGPVGARRAGAAAAAAAGPRELSSQMSVPLMQEHADSPPSCSSSHLGSGPGATAPLAHADGGAAISDATFSAAIRAASVGRGPVGRRSSDGSAGATPVPAAGGAAVMPAAAAGRVTRLSDPAGLQTAADSAVELHTMCDCVLPCSTSSSCDASATVRKAGASSAGPPCVSGSIELQGSSTAAPLPAAALWQGMAGGSSDLRASGGSDSLPGSFTGSGDSVGRFNSQTGRSGSRTRLLPTIASSSNICHLHDVGATVQPLSNLGKRATAAAGCATGGSKQQQPSAKQQKRRLSPVAAFAARHPLMIHVVSNQLQSFHLWLNVLAIVLSVSGARAYLDPASPSAIPALGFIDGVLAWFSAACIPTLLFANGVWMCGKDVLCGGWRGQLKVLAFLALKLTLLPALMVALTLACGVRGAQGLSLVLLASCPLAPLAFLVCQQYGAGAELATAVTIQGVLLMLPQMMAVIKINEVARLYDVQLVAA